MLDRLLYRGAACRLARRFTETECGRMHERFSEGREADRIVLVHGIGTSGRYLLPTAGRLAARFSVHVPDLPGFGSSGRPKARPTVGYLAGSLLAWLEAIGIEEPVALVGNSFGCQVIAELAARRPDRVSAAVLVGPTVDRHARSPIRQLWRLGVDTAREPPGLWGIQAVDYARHLTKSGVSGFREMLRDPVEAKLVRVGAPVLVVRGARDAIVSRRWAWEVAELLQQGRYVEVEDASHAVNYAAPQELARLIQAFLRQTRAERPTKRKEEEHDERQPAG